MKFSHTETKRACWSKHYAATVAKGGIDIHPLGWIRTLTSCTGGIGDTGYLTEVMVFEEQEEFAHNDPTLKESFLNILTRDIGRLWARRKMDGFVCNSIWLKAIRNSKETENFTRRIVQS
jgi:hypothetical protein